MAPPTAPAPRQLPLPLDDRWSPLSVARLDRRQPIGHVRVALGPRSLALRLRTTARASDLLLRADGDGPGSQELQLTVTLAPVFTVGSRSSAVRPLYWGLSRGLLSDEGEFFGFAARWASTRLRWGLPRGWARLGLRPVLASLLREAASAMAARLDPAARAAVRPFPARLRASLHARLLRDERGWLRQAFAAAPGPVLFALALSERAETADAGARLFCGLGDGERLADALGEATEAWWGATERWARQDSTWSNGARRAFAVARDGDARAAMASLRYLVRRAGPLVEPSLLLLPPPLWLAPTDIPATPRANAAWYRVMRTPGITVAAAGADPTEHRRAFAGFASRHAELLARVPAGLTLDRWLAELSGLLRDTGRAPSRDTNPAALVASVDVEALRRREPPADPWFVHAADAEAEPRAAPAPPPEPPEEDTLCARRFATWSRDGVAVRQLTTLRDLRAEGARQHNCVATYEEEVRRGRVVILSVTVGGKPLTLSVVSAAGRWAVSELKGFANRRASAAEWAALGVWMREVGVGR
jgi:hypothetical protein